MKTLIALIITMAATNVLAFHADPSTLNPSQKTQLIASLNKMAPEVLDSILSDEALEWYINQHNSAQNESFELNEQNYEIKHGRIDIDFTLRPTFDFN